MNDTFSICYLFNVVRKYFYVSDNNFSKRKQPMSGIYRTIIRNAINVISNYEQCLIRSCANCRIVKTTFLVYLYSSTTLISLQISTPAMKKNLQLHVYFHTRNLNQNYLSLNISQDHHYYYHCFYHYYHFTLG